MKKQTKCFLAFFLSLIICIVFSICNAYTIYGQGNNDQLTSLSDDTSTTLYTISGILRGDARDRVPVELLYFTSPCGGVPDWAHKVTTRATLINGIQIAFWSFPGQEADTYRIVPEFGRYSFIPEYREVTLPPPDRNNIVFEMIAPDPPYINGIVCLGDSLTAHDVYPPYLSVLTGLPCFNEGKAGGRVCNYYSSSGEEIYGMSARFYEDVESYFPSNCTTLGGINDIMFDASLSSIESCYADIFPQASSAGIRLTVVSVLPFKGYQGWTEEKQAIVDNLNEWLFQQSLKDPNATFVNAYTPLEDPDNEDTLLPEYDSGDHLHLSTAGYEKLAEEIYIQSFQ